MSFTFVTWPHRAAEEVPTLLVVELYARDLHPLEKDTDKNAKKNEYFISISLFLFLIF
jgi:hypothetical protein